MSYGLRCIVCGLQESAHFYEEFADKNCLGYVSPAKEKEDELNLNGKPDIDLSGTKFDKLTLR